MSTCPPRKPLNVNISKPDSGAHPTAGFCSRISNQDWLLFFRLFSNAFLSSLEYPSSSVHSVRGVVKVRGGGLHSSENEGSRGFVGHQTGPTVTMCPLTRLFARRVLQSKQPVYRTITLLRTVSLTNSQIHHFLLSPGTPSNCDHLEVYGTSWVSS